MLPVNEVEEAIPAAGEPRQMEGELRGGTVVSSKVLVRPWGLLSLEGERDRLEILKFHTKPFILFASCYS